MSAVRAAVVAAAWPSTESRVGRLLADLAIEGPGGFRVGAGPAIPVASVAPFPPARPVADPASRLSEALAAVIYSAAYCRLYAGPGYDPALRGKAPARDPVFVATLDVANASRAEWDRGWRVFRRDGDGAVHVAKGERATRLAAGRYAMPNLLRPADVGDEVERHRERASLALQPGLYFAFGETPSCDYDDARMARFYFDLDAPSATWVLDRLSRLLNRYAVPFSFKCPTDPAGFDRQDSAVLYVARRYAPTVVALLWPARAAFEAQLRGGHPLWCRPVFPGVGAADDPATGESFGQSRSRLVAAAVVEAWRAGRQDVRSREAAVAERFRRVGLDVARPHLALGLADVYGEPAP